MRGSDGIEEALFTMSKQDDFVPSAHPLRSIRVLVNEALGHLNGLFNEVYADTGRASIAPEKLMRALLLQVIYSVRSERQVCEQLRYNLLFRWFVGLAIDNEVWDHSVFSKNRDRLLEHAVVEAFFTAIMQLADAKGLLSKEHFSVDGTLIQAWPSHKSFRPKDGSNDQTPSGPGRNAQADWKGKPRTNDTHESSTDPDSRLFRKSDNTASILCSQGHVLMENRSGLVVGAVVTHADGTGERAAALTMLDTVPGKQPKSIGGQSLRHPRHRRRVPRAKGHCARGEQHTENRPNVVRGTARRGVMNRNPRAIEQIGKDPTIRSTANESSSAFFLLREPCQS